MTPEQYILHLQLKPHPEGGFYKQTYYSAENISAAALPRRFSRNLPFSTAIYYLLEQGDFSAFHKIKSDECWHFYAGDALLIHVLNPEGLYSCVKLGNQIENDELFQYIVPAEAWFAVEPAPHTHFALVGCTVAPGFDFEDFEIADKRSLLLQFPQHELLINKLCR